MYLNVGITEHTFTTVLNNKHFKVFFKMSQNSKTMNKRAELGQRLKCKAFIQVFKCFQRGNKKVLKHFVPVNKAQCDAACNDKNLIALPRVYSVGCPKKQHIRVSGMQKSNAGF